MLLLNMNSENLLVELGFPLFQVFLVLTLKTSHYPVVKKNNITNWAMVIIIT